jgi:hypothetical protein
MRIWLDRAFSSKNTTTVFSYVNTTVVLFLAGNKKPAEAGFDGH